MSRCRGGVVRAKEAFLRRGGKGGEGGGGGIPRACLWVCTLEQVVVFLLVVFLCAVVLRFACVVLCKTPFSGTCRIIADSGVVVALS